MSHAADGSLRLQDHYVRSLTFGPSSNLAFEAELMRLIRGESDRDIQVPVSITLRCSPGELTE